MLNALRDAWVEFRIHLLAHGEMTPAKWLRLCTLIQNRSPRQIQRMEKRKGLS